jgi:hypothetical protein
MEKITLYNNFKDLKSSNFKIAKENSNDTIEKNNIKNFVTLLKKNAIQKAKVIKAINK